MIRLIGMVGVVLCISISTAMADPSPNLSTIIENHADVINQHAAILNNSTAVIDQHADVLNRNVNAIESIRKELALQRSVIEKLMQYSLNLEKQIEAQDGRILKLVEAVSYLRRVSPEEI